MSSYFSKVIKAGERQREFNFKLTSVNDLTRYSVDVPDDKGNRVFFSMYQNANGQWKTAAQLVPLWIHNAEDQLAEAIQENLKLNAVKK